MTHKEMKQYMLGVMNGTITPSFTENECWIIRWYLYVLMQYREYDEAIENGDEWAINEAEIGLKTYKSMERMAPAIEKQLKEQGII